jgi:hypothetical protein
LICRGLLLALQVNFPFVLILSDKTLLLHGTPPSQVSIRMNRQVGSERPPVLALRQVRGNLHVPAVIRRTPTVKHAELRLQQVRIIQSRAVRADHKVDFRLQWLL